MTTVNALSYHPSSNRVSRGIIPQMWRLYISICMWVLSAVGLAHADPQVQEYTLNNGLKVVVKADHRAPVVVAQVWYKVGGSYEHSGITGLSHMLEHMMFKGTPKHPAGEFSRIIAENGGSENAFTSKDYTAYFQQLEKSRLPISFEMEADRMRNLNLPPAEFTKELEVVKEERRTRTDDNPQALVSEQFYATAFVNNPYHQPIIGWMDDLNHMSVQDLRDWYARWYAPNNATLVVVGDVEPEQVHKLAEKYYGDIAKQTIPELKPRHETEQTGERRITVRAPAKLPYLIMGYKTPSLKTAEKDWEPYALDMLAGVLSGSNSARFQRDLVRKQQLVASASAGYDLYSRQSDLFELDATPADKHSVAEVEQALLKQIDRVKRELVSKDELERIKAQVLASKVYERDSVFYQAMQLGMLETVGLGWQRVDEYPQRLQAVTAEQIQQVAKKYLVPEHLTVAILDPLPLDKDVMPQPPMSNMVR